jgi:hypothetical protein
MILAKERPLIRTRLAGASWAVQTFPPMTNCGGRYAPGYRRPACPLSMACRNPTQELAAPASCAAGR